MTFAISILKFFAYNCLIRKDHRLFFRFAKIFQFFVVAPYQQIFEIFEKVEFLHDHEELEIGNGTVIFSEQSAFRNANNFLNLTQLKMIDFWSSADLT